MNTWHLIVGLAAAALFLWLSAVTLPGIRGRARLLHLVYGAAVLVLGLAAGWFWNDDYRARVAGEKAMAILDEHFTPEGMIHASLSFLERYRTVYPDAYARAREICRQRNCLEPVPAEMEGREAARRMHEINDAAVSLRAILIALTSEDDRHGH